MLVAGLNGARQGQLNTREASGCIRKSLEDQELKKKFEQMQEMNNFLQVEVDSLHQNSLRFKEQELKYMSQINELKQAFDEVDDQAKNLKF